MSADSGVNAALLNFCAQIQDRGAGSAVSPAAQTTASAGGTVAAAQSSSLTAVASDAPRPAADYEWLRGALASVEAPEKRVKELLLDMENRTAAGEQGTLSDEERLDALAELSDMVEDVNWATEFALMQGPARLLQVLRRERVSAATASTTSTTAAAAAGIPTSAAPLLTALAMVAAHSSQLNEPVQAAYQAAHWEEVLLPFMSHTIDAVRALLSLNDPEAMPTQATVLLRLLAALLHACSCLCRDCPPNTIVLIRNDGLARVADALRLTARLQTWVSTATAASATGGAPVVVTIAAGVGASEHTMSDADAPDGDDDVYAPLLSVANKVTTRALFFTSYLASTGVSSEDIIQLTCQHAANATTGEAVQNAAARALTALLERSPKAIKEAVHLLMPQRLNEWRTQLQRGAGDDVDERQQFVAALARIG
ncbi:hypothetical protein NESM_000459300 [Novymonas esmeraldas]|uniref:Uncharacterized protein n=1 Tax=Novymonas esmeraldas TaxID=1808958 RepID=A0AAW0EQA9_9TRYP